MTNFVRHEWLLYLARIKYTDGVQRSLIKFFACNFRESIVLSLLREN